MTIKRWFLYAGKILGALLLLICSSALILYIYYWGDYAVLATTVDDPDLPSIQIDGVRLHAESHGPANAPLVIALHGGPGNDYRALLDLKQLSDRYRVVFYDQRGSGLSQRLPVEKLTVASLVEELRLVASHYAPGQPVYLVGHSWGAMLATAFIGEHPELVRGAVLIEPGFLNAEFGREFMRRTNGMMPPINSETLGLFLRSIFQSMHVSGPDDDAAMDYVFMQVMLHPSRDNPIAGYFCGGDPANAVLPGWRFGSTISNAMMQAAVKDGEFQIDLTRGLQHYKRPVLFLAGDCNTIIGPDIQKRQAQLFPKASLRVIEGAGHSLLGEKPQVVLPIIRRYLAEH
ncbi:MAG: alpha/beta hydrolase [Leptospiraceae bacterium]|nr:alpha/beta hydrolase [Leptospiraceae bacterium]